MSSAAEIVERYFDAWSAKDFAAARALLHDDLSFAVRSRHSTAPTQ